MLAGGHVSFVACVESRIVAGNNSTFNGPMTPDVFFSFFYNTINGTMNELIFKMDVSMSYTYIIPDGAKHHSG